MYMFMRVVKYESLLTCFTPKFQEYPKEPLQEIAWRSYGICRGGSRPVYKVCKNLSEFFPKIFLSVYCKVQMIPDFMGSEFTL